MIVDLHTRIWDTIDEMGQAAAMASRRRRDQPWQDLTASASSHSEAMEPVAHAAVLGFESQLLGAHIDAERVAEHVKSQPEKLLGFVGIDPTAGKAVQKLEAALDLGLVGLTISPAAAGFHPADTRAMALFEACQDKKIPVLIECGSSMAQQVQLEFAQPYLLDEVARAFPDLKIVLTSFGLPWIDQGVTMLAKHPNVFADVSGLVVRSWQLYNALVNAYQANVMKQVLFGSGFPFCDPQTAIVTIYSVNTTSQGTPLPSVPREQLRSVVERDALKVLGIIRPNGTATEDEKKDEGGSEFERVAVSEDAES